MPLKSSVCNIEMMQKSAVKYRSHGRARLQSLVVLFKNGNLPIVCVSLHAIFFATLKSCQPSEQKHFEARFR